MCEDSSHLGWNWAGYGLGIGDVYPYLYLYPVEINDCFQAYLSWTDKIWVKHQWNSYSLWIGEKQGSRRCDAWIWILLDMHTTNYEILQFHKSWLLS